MMRLLCCKSPLTLLLVPLCLAACGGGAGAGTDSPSPNATPAIQRSFAYVADDFSNTVSAYSINSATGELTPVGLPVTAGNLPTQIAVHPGGKFAYASNTSYQGVSAYRINAATGALTQIGATGNDSTNGTSSVAVDPGGKFLFVPNNYPSDSPFPPPQEPQSISTWRIDAANGALTLASTVVIGRVITSIEVPRDGNVAFVKGEGQNFVAAYAIDPASGVLALLATADGVGVGRIAAHPGGKFVFAANSAGSGPGQVSTYQLNLAAGTLTRQGLPVTTGVAPQSIAVHPNGNLAYVANQNSNDIWIYRIDDASGALTQSGAPVSAGNPKSIAFDPSGQFAYVGMTSGIQAYRVDPTTGALTTVGAPLPRTRLAVSIATTRTSE